MKNLTYKGRFYYEKPMHIFRHRVMAVLVFILVYGCFYQGMNYLSDRTLEEQKKNMEEVIWHGITQCYAIEGRYPESLEYLKKEYGVQYDTEHFFVDYQVLGENIMPDVTVVEK